MPARPDRRRWGFHLAAAVIAVGCVTGCSSPQAGPSENSRGAVPSPGAAVGLPEGVRLTSSGDIAATTPGTVVDGMDVRGTITVQAPDVRIVRTRVTCAAGDLYAIVVEPGGSATIEDSELTGDCSSGALQGQDFVADGIDIHGVTSDGIKIDGGNVVIKNSVVRDFSPADGAHADGIQASVPIGNVTITGSIIDPGPTTNGAIFFVPQLENGSTPGPVLLEGNTFGGGGDTVHIGAAEAGDLGVVRVIDNVWRRNSAFGPVYRTGYKTAEWSGNRYEDGAPVGPP